MQLSLNMHKSDTKKLKKKQTKKNKQTVKKMIK